MDKWLIGYREALTFPLRDPSAVDGAGFCCKKDRIEWRHAKVFSAPCDVQRPSLTHERGPRHIVKACLYEGFAPG